MIPKQHPRWISEPNANTLEDVLDAFSSHTSIKRIRRTVKTNEKFSFKLAAEDLVREIILNLNSSKATSVGDFPVDMLKSTVDKNLPFVTKIIHFFLKMFFSQMSLKWLKLAVFSKVMIN